MSGKVFVGGEGWLRKEKKETKEKEQTRGQPGNRKQQDFEHKVRPDWAKGERHALGGSSYGCLFALMRRNSDRCLVAEDGLDLVSFPRKIWLFVVGVK